MKAIGFSKIKEGDHLFVFGKDGETDATYRGVVTGLLSGTDPDHWFEVTLNDNMSFELFKGEHVVILLDRPREVVQSKIAASAILNRIADKA